MLLGLRGTGKTVLLARLAEIAEGHDALTAQLEAPETGDMPVQLLPLLQTVLRKISVREAAREAVHKAYRALRSFSVKFKLEPTGATLSVDPVPGVADSGRLDLDLSDVMEAVGRAAQADGRAVVIMVDEVQYLSSEELSALITALHRTTQKTLPVLFVGAGLPQVAGLAGDAKSYAERLFVYHDIGPLPEDDAAKAIREPVEKEGERIEPAAVAMIVERTEGYPYFLQEWGYQSWNAANASPISKADVDVATDQALRRLDAGFFKVRLDRLTPKEREYVHAMADLPGDGPYRSGDVAEHLGEPATRMGPRRHAIIRKGMIYSPAHGDIAFTVPGFKDYLHRVKAMADASQ